jgi:hypothetical protein
MLTNRYTELTDTQKAHVDAYINALASEGQTEITHAVKHWAEKARTALTQLEDIAKYTARGHNSQRTGDLRLAQQFTEKTTGKVRHALAMIVDATVRPTLND